MKIHSTLRALGALTVVGGLLVSSGCSDTTLVGQTDDTELQDEVALPFVGLGMSREINDLIFANLSEFNELRGLTDNHLAGASGSSTLQMNIGLLDRGENGAYEQTHEAIWTAYKVVDIGIGVRGLEAAQASPIVAKAWLNAGFMERVMADAFCEVTYQYGPFGGFNMNGFLPDWAGNARPEFDRGTPLQKDSLYERAAYAFQQAIATAETAIAQGVEPPDEDPTYFDPDSTRVSGYAGLAQAHASLAQLGVDPAANWAAAVQAAAEVDNSHIEFWNTDDELRNNQNWIDMWTDNEATVWSGVHDGTQWGAAVTHPQILEAAGTRVQPRECQNFATLVGSEEDVFADNNVVNTPLASTPEPEGCDARFEDGDNDIERDGIPRWLDVRWQERFHDVAAVRGTQMRLIEAEAALFDNDLPLFTEKINEIRAFHDAPPIAQPASVGQLEYPNAMDDAWSILDAEALLETYGELRRLAFLHNWEHPFITENHTLLPVFRDELEARGAGFQRASCFPIPSNECNLNTSLTCPDL